MFAYMLDHFHRRAALLSKQISAQARPRECGWVMRDVRRDNLFFGEFNASDANQRTLTGVIDFASVRMDWPWFDWVRVLTTNLPTKDVDSWHAAHDSFRRRTNFSLSWSDFADLAEASLLLSGMYWLGKQLAGDPLSPMASLGCKKSWDSSKTFLGEMEMVQERGFGCRVDLNALIHVG